MSGRGDIKPAGYAATAAGFPGEAARDSGDREDLAVRQLAALQGIGYELLALGEQLPGLADAVTGNGGQVAQVTAAIDDLYREPVASRVRGLLTRLRGRR